ncbi:DNA methylase N-4/N-6 domain protein [Gloeothece citriformis PCC 7424]|uniref:Methyltransferase n=1 Tax=Gloeothece citriformis (strain PCC 7424) TaxID=65393 RepID=B7KB97_GLOC7|nr:site-specific DNA-methyltransferase [Gloeothece citriformis]ACK71453.1 DNA methylase N-4/N-6 domain protein [Gloeothece citriformis PCC 7424]
MLDSYIDKILLGDCLDLFSKIPDESIDVTFADPPFNFKKKYGNIKDNLEFKEYLKWCELWIDEMIRVTKPSGSIFIHNIPKWLTYYCSFLNEKSNFRHWISWDAPTAPMGKTLQPSHYGILFYAKTLAKNKFYEIRYSHKRCRKCNYLYKDYGGKKDSIHPFGPLVSDVWTDIHRIKHNKYRDNHPCQLPVHLLERIILMSTDESDIILDPFMGTGTTAIAAKRLGRHYIGFEINELYLEVAEGKLRQEKDNSKIGNVWVSFFPNPKYNSVVTIRDKDWEELAQNYFIPKERKLLDSVKIKLKFS